MPKLTISDLISEGLITHSLAEVIFTNNEEAQEELLSFRNVLTTGYRICFCYTALLQAYIIGKAIKEDCSVEELQYTKLVKAIKKIWVSEEKYVLNGMSIFSMLYECAKDQNPEFTTTNTEHILVIFRKNYELAENDNVRYKKSDLKYDNLKELLRALPLLSHTEYDDTNGKLTFFDDDQKVLFTIPATPFINFWNIKKNNSTTHQTDNLGILSSVAKGGKNGELHFHIQVFEEGEAQVIDKHIFKQANNNEYLRLICKKLNITTDWYPVDDCFCDISFLANLTKTTSEVLELFWNKYPQKEMFFSDNIMPNLKKMFIGSEIESKIDDTQIVSMDELSNIFYELFINYGMFKTMCGLFLDTKKWSYGQKLFQLFLDELEQREEFLSAERRMECEEKCQININQHVTKLKAIVHENSRQYDTRYRMIHAEWYAYHLLTVMGLNADNIFADEENIRSIDDYYDMLGKERDHSLRGLREVLIMLNGLYGALLTAEIEFNEKEFSEQMKIEYQKNKAKSLESLMTSFQEIVVKSEKNNIIDHFMGRNKICDAKKLKEHFRNIIRELGDVTSKIENLKQKRKKIFISYSHKDSNIVERFVKTLNNVLKDKVDIFFDTQLHGGQHWIDVAKKEIDDPQCIGLIAFTSLNSIKSEAVAFELEHAGIRWENMDKAIIGINLEETPINDYLKKMAHSSEEGSHSAISIRKILNEYKIYLTLPEQITKLIDDIECLIANASNNLELIDDIEYNELELAIANFYAFLKFGEKHRVIYKKKELDIQFKENAPCEKKCIFPLVASVKETKIKRDNITLVGYEIIGGKGEIQRGTNYILSSRRLGTDDYYCIPNSHRTGKGCSWMVEPLLICHNLFPIIEEEDFDV